MQRTVDATCNANVHPPVREDRHRSCAPLVSRAASTRRTLRGPDRSLLTVQQDTGALPGHGGAQFELHRIHRCLHIQHVCFFPDRFAQFTHSCLLTIIRHRSTSDTKIAQRSAAAYAASCKRCGAGASRASCPTVAHAACSDVAVPWQVHHGHHVRSVDPARCDQGQHSGRRSAMGSSTAGCARHGRVRSVMWALSMAAHTCTHALLSRRQTHIRRVAHTLSAYKRLCVATLAMQAARRHFEEFGVISI